MVGGRTPSPFGGCTFVLGGGAIRGRGIRLVGVTVSHKQSAVFYLFPSSSCSTSLFCFVRFGCVLFFQFLLSQLQFNHTFPHIHMYVYFLYSFILGCYVHRCVNIICVYGWVCGWGRVILWAGYNL